MDITHLNTTSRPSLRAGVDAWCKGCNYQPEEPGAWRQQTAACEITDCPLYPVRPVPRDCSQEGVIDEEACSAIRDKLRVRRT